MPAATAQRPSAAVQEASRENEAASGSYGEQRFGQRSESMPGEDLGFAFSDPVAQCSGKSPGYQGGGFGDAFYDSDS